MRAPRVKFINPGSTSLNADSATTVMTIAASTTTCTTALVAIDNSTTGIAAEPTSTMDDSLSLWNMTANATDTVTVTVTVTETICPTATSVGDGTVYEGMSMNDTELAGNDTDTAANSTVYDTNSTEIDSNNTSNGTNPHEDKKSGKKNHLSHKTDHHKKDQKNDAEKDETKSSKFIARIHHGYSAVGGAQGDTFVDVPSADEFAGQLVDPRAPPPAPTEDESDIDEGV
jgi:hypothetical protein